MNEPEGAVMASVLVILAIAFALYRTESAWRVRQRERVEVLPGQPIPVVNTDRMKRTSAQTKAALDAATQALQNRLEPLRWGVASTRLRKGLRAALPPALAPFRCDGKR